MRRLLSKPFANFVLAIAFIGLFFTVPKLLAGLLNPLFPMSACMFGFLYFGRRMVHSFR